MLKVFAIIGVVAVGIALFKAFGGWLILIVAGVVIALLMKS